MGLDDINPISGLFNKAVEVVADYGFGIDLDSVIDLAGDRFRMHAGQVETDPEVQGAIDALANDIIPDLIRNNAAQLLAGDQEGVMANAATLLANNYSEMKEDLKEHGFDIDQASPEQLQQLNDAIIAGSEGIAQDMQWIDGQAFDFAGPGGSAPPSSTPAP